MIARGDSEEEDEDDMQRDDWNILDFELQPIFQLSSSPNSTRHTNPLKSRSSKSSHSINVAGR